MLSSGEFSKNISSEYKNSNHTYNRLVEEIRRVESEENHKNDLVFVIDNDNKFLYANNLFQNSYQYTIAELINLDLNKIFLSYNNIKTNNGPSIQNKLSVSQKLLSLKKDKSLVEVNITILPIYGSNKELCGYTNIISHFNENILDEEIIPRLLKEFNGASQNFPDIFIKIDKDGNIKDFKFIDLTEENFTRTILIKGNINILLPQVSIKKLLSSLRKLKNKNEIETFEVPIIIDGIKSIFKIDLTSTSSEFFLITLKDVTKIKNSENEIRKNVSKFYALWNYSLDGMRLLNKAGIIVAVNPSFCKLVEMKPNELIGKPFHVIYSEQNLIDIKAIEQKIKNAFNDRNFKNYFEGELYLKCNKKKYFDVSSTIIESQTSNPLFERDAFLLSIFRDITERKISEDALRNSEMLFRSIWKRSHDGMRLTDKDGNIISVNKSFCKLFQIEENELLNKPFYKVYKQSDEENEISLNNYRKLFNEKTVGINHWEHKILHNGKSIYLDVSFSFLELKDKGNLLLSVFRDDTKYKKIEQDLQNSERLAAIGTMSAFLAHEIKKPTAAIKSYVEMLCENIYLPDDTKDTLELLNDAVGHLNKLLNDVLLFSQNKELIKIKIDLKSLIDKVHELLHKKLNDCNIRFLNNVKDIYINGDYFNLISVFTNLIENSIEAISSNGEIIISSVSNEKNYSIYIEDSGKGINENEKIFNPFYTTKSSGTGLGLSIVKKILENHDGSIRLLSSRPGKTIFEIKFPRNNSDGKDTNN